MCCPLPFATGPGHESSCRVCPDDSVAETTKSCQRVGDGPSPADCACGARAIWLGYGLLCQRRVYGAGFHHRQRPASEGERRASHAPRSLPAGTFAPDRHARRLRHEPVRRVYRARRRPQRRSRARCSRCRPTAPRSPPSRVWRRTASASSAPAGLLGGARPAVRVLHAGDDPVGGRPAEGQPEVRPSARSERASPGISAAAPAISTS